MKKTILLATGVVMLSGCVSIFMPKKQKIKINTDNAKTTVYIDNEEFGKGSEVKGKVKKDGAKQVVLQTPGYKDQYAALIGMRRPIAYYPMIILDIPLYYGLVFDLMNPKGISYNKTNTFKSEDKLVLRDAAKEKRIDISNIKLSIKNRDRDINSFYLAYSTDLAKTMKDAEKKADSKQAKADMKKKKADMKKKKGKSLNEAENNEIKYDDIKYSENVYKTLRNTGYVDTLNKVFTDDNNTVILEGNIKKLNTYFISKKSVGGAYQKAKLFTTWYIKNSYNEILDSIDTQDLSGDFAYPEGSVFNGSRDKEDYNTTLSKMYGDAIDNSYLRLHKNTKFTKYLKQEPNFTINDPQLSIGKPQSAVVSKADAGYASVIIKRKDKGHGSGFAISNDGYIVTNYHVVADKYPGKLSPIKVITNDGEELEATIVRYNKFRDLALIKVDYKFKKAFEVSNTKAFEPMQDVLTIGAPKSVELGQSVSTGIISNERKANNNNVLQLSMSVNGGNSGGPLYDTNGKLHGVIVSKLVGTNTEGVSFAIPSYLMQDYLKIEYK
ncbi:MAG: serine protease [Bacteroidia bacterium]|nr:serine protease [Bacteroidia bacterium]